MCVCVCCLCMPVSEREILLFIGTRDKHLSGSFNVVRSLGVRPAGFGLLGISREMFCLVQPGSCFHNSGLF